MIQPNTEGTKDPVGDELVAFMTAHLGDTIMAAGEYDEVRPPFLSFCPWIPASKSSASGTLVKKKKWQVKIGCSGLVRVLDDHSRPKPSSNRYIQGGTKPFTADPGEGGR